MNSWKVLMFIALIARSNSDIIFYTGYWYTGEPHLVPSGTPNVCTDIPMAFRGQISSIEFVDGGPEHQMAIFTSPDCTPDNIHRLFYRGKYPDLRDVYSDNPWGEYEHFDDKIASYGVITEPVK